MGINKINSKSNWGEAAANLNSNFDTLNAAILQIKGATTRNKGFYSTPEALIAAVPTGQLGDVAYVGAPEALAIWEWNGSEWVDSGNVGSIDVDLNEYYTKEAADEKFAKSRFFDGGRADTVYGGAREVNCGGADAYLI